MVGVRGGSGGRMIVRGGVDRRGMRRDVMIVMSGGCRGVGVIVMPVPMIVMTVSGRGVVVMPMGGRRMIVVARRCGGVAVIVVPVVVVMTMGVAMAVIVRPTVRGGMAVGVVRPDRFRHTHKDPPE